MKTLEKIQMTDFDARDKKVCVFCNGTLLSSDRLQS